MFARQPVTKADEMLFTRTNKECFCIVVLGWKIWFELAFSYTVLYSAAHCTVDMPDTLEPFCTTLCEGLKRLSLYLLFKVLGIHGKFTQTN